MRYDLVFLDVDTQRGFMDEDGALPVPGAREIRGHLQKAYPLAVSGTLAPLLGLFGTVIGIINAFSEIGAAGSASLAVVAPGIAEALIATALGLFAAIPATIAYNIFVGRLGEIHSDLELFAQEFDQDLRREPASSDPPIRAAGA